ncbi:uncharacterized protein IL334_005706 [Kwoniella shivajii]|uniref:Uncharacterized protein n=1 Tax=Kwoniella shivajii TaxID=564305 RepID=A0ABZ1D3V8_9TREE|nr:hypothetical protein IL334_005706 [Kwoniella shivajii]
MLIRRIACLSSTICTFQLRSVVATSDPVTDIVIQWGKGVRGAYSGTEASDANALEFIWDQEELDNHVKKEFYVLLYEHHTFDFDGSEEFKDLQANISCYAEAKKAENSVPWFYFSNPHILPTSYLSGGNSDLARIYCPPDENADFRDWMKDGIDSVSAHATP